MSVVDNQPHPLALGAHQFKVGHINNNALPLGTHTQPKFVMPANLTAMLPYHHVDEEGSTEPIGFNPTIGLATKRAVNPFTKM